MDKQLNVYGISLSSGIELTACSNILIMENLLDYISKNKWTVFETESSWSEDINKASYEMSHVVVRSKDIIAIYC